MQTSKEFCSNWKYSYLSEQCGWDHVRVQDKPFPSYPISRKHLGSILVSDLDYAWSLNPGFPIHLHWDTFFTINGYHHLMALQEKRSRMGCIKSGNYQRSILKSHSYSLKVCLKQHQQGMLLDYPKEKQFCLLLPPSSLSPASVSTLMPTR